MRKSALTILAAVAATNLWAIQGSLSTETETVSGDIKWHAREKKYIIEKGKVTKEFPLDDVTSLDIPKPAGFDKAVAQVDEGKGAAAVPVLTKIVEDYRMLQWDKPAGRYLAFAYLAADNAKKAYEIASAVVADDKRAAYTGDIAPAYWQAMLKLGKTQQLLPLLKKAATSGDRVASAEAVLMRGDIILAEGGDAAAVYRQALSDSYLRVALMYNDKACRDVCVAAKIKAAKCFDKLGMAARAEQFRSEARAGR